MKRDAYKSLLNWKSSERRKPLLLRGARQTGKTYLLREFGKQEYQNFHYFNFEQDRELHALFEQDLNPHRILKDLSLYGRRKITEGVDLIFFDEIQTCNKALNALKYFQEQANAFHVVAAGSLLGVKVSSPGSFPVGKVSFMDLHPLTFAEFLNAIGESEYRKLLENQKSFLPLAEPFHKKLVEFLKQYYFVGGMPEVVKHFIKTSKADEVRTIQQEIVDSYVLDFAKHAPTSDIPKLSHIWDSIPSHLARENKKFVFSAVRKGARSREYENALIWLEKAGLVYRVSMVKKSEFPLKHYSDRSAFKIYALDVGLLGAMAKSPIDLLAQGERLFHQYEGAFVENYVAQQLVTLLGPDLYYWQSSGGKAELDFLCEIGERIYPVEVTAGHDLRSKSLNSYSKQFSGEVLLRASLSNFSENKKLKNIPLYALMKLKDLV